jgi:hypothetical protein
MIQIKLAFEQCHNVPAVAAAESLPDLATDVVQAPATSNNSNRCLASSGPCGDRLGKPETLLADSRLFQRGSILTPGILNSMPGPRSRLSSLLSSRRSSSRRSSRRSAPFPSRSRVSTHRYWQTGPSHSCRHTRCASACWGINAVMAATVAAIPKVLKIILTSSSFRNSATDPGADRHGKFLSYCRGRPTACRCTFIQARFSEVHLLQCPQTNQTHRQNASA